MCDNIRKIGMSSSIYGDRLDAYGKERVVYATAIVTSSGACENKLKQAFSSMFTLVKGTETFKGDVTKMTQLFLNIIQIHILSDPLVSCPVVAPVPVNNNTIPIQINDSIIGDQSMIVITKQWINGHPCENRETRGRYYARYCKKIHKRKISPISMSQFATTMISLGYIQGGTTSKRLWIRVSDDSDDELTDSDDSD